MIPVARGRIKRSVSSTIVKFKIIIISLFHIMEHLRYGQIVRIHNQGDEGGA
jgi:hypothetical protein